MPRRASRISFGAKIFLSSTVRQIALQKALAYPTPRYLHMPLVVDAAGQKWAKQTGAPALDNAQARSNLHRALTLLGLQSDPQDPCHRQLDDGCRQWPAVALRKGALPLRKPSVRASFCYHR